MVSEPWPRVPFKNENSSEVISTVSSQLAGVTTGAAISAQLKRLKEASGQANPKAGPIESDIQAANLNFEG
jgi:hypothetical protein